MRKKRVLSGLKLAGWGALLIILALVVSPTKRVFPKQHPAIITLPIGVITVIFGIGRAIGIVKDSSDTPKDENYREPFEFETKTLTDFNRAKHLSKKKQPCPHCGSSRVTSFDSLCPDCKKTLR